MRGTLAISVLRYSQKSGQNIGCKTLKSVQIPRISFQRRHFVRRQSIHSRGYTLLTYGTNSAAAKAWHTEMFGALRDRLGAESVRVGVQSHMPIEERVTNAQLILIGKLGPPGTTGRHTTIQVRVEEVLFGEVPTNKTLFVSYKTTGWLIPEIASRIHVPRPGSPWIFFVTADGVTQPPARNYFTRAVGPQKYAHDGLELATDEVVRRVRGLVAQKRKDK